STKVVLPWSTWATIATLRMSSREGMRVQCSRGGRNSVYGADPRSTGPRRGVTGGFAPRRRSVNTLDRSRAYDGQDEPKGEGMPEHDRMQLDRRDFLRRAAATGIALPSL